MPQTHSLIYSLTHSLTNLRQFNHFLSLTTRFSKIVLFAENHKHIGCPDPSHDSFNNIKQHWVALRLTHTSLRHFALLFLSFFVYLFRTSDTIRKIAQSLHCQRAVRLSLGVVVGYHVLYDDFHSIFMFP